MKRSSILILSALLSTIPRARSQEDLPDMAWLGGNAVQVRTSMGLRDWPGTEGADTFCADRRSGSVLITRNQALLRVNSKGESTELVRDVQSIRFPDVDRREGRIAFAYVEVGTPKQSWKLRLIDAEGKGTRELGTGYDPSFTSDGKSIVFEDHDARGTDLWIMDLATGRRQYLFPEPAKEPRHTPVSAPNGIHVAFTFGGRLHLCSLDGTAIQDLSPEGKTYDRFAAFSADSKSLVFFREREGQTSLVYRLLFGREQIIPAPPHATIPIFLEEPTNPAPPGPEPVKKG